MTDVLRVAALTGGVEVPSARFRVGQFVAPLRDLGIDLNWRTAPVRKHPPRTKLLRPLWFPASVAGRIPGVIDSWRADVTLFSRELVSTFVTLEPLTRRPRVLDVDDAIWLHRGGDYARRLATLADTVIAGNDYVAEWASQYCDRVEILPTAVDTDRFVPGEKREDYEDVVIGWSGTSSNFPYLIGLERALLRVMRERSRAHLAISSDRRPVMPDLPADRVTYVPWSVNSEVPFLQSLDVGLMPLADDDWSRGKCSYKMLLYLACGVPVVVTPVGMNAQVLTGADVGFGPISEDDWVDALLNLVDDATLRRRLGGHGVDLVQNHYSMDIVTPRLAALLSEVSGVKSP